MDQLQAHNTICIVWLMGSHPKAINPRDMEEIVKKIQFLEQAEAKMDPFAFQCKVRSQAIQRGRYWLENCHKGVTHPCTSDDNWKVFTWILKIFSSANKLGFPLGHEYWFVPNTIDSRIPNPKKQILCAAKMRERQHIFLEKWKLSQHTTLPR